MSNRRTGEAAEGWHRLILPAIVSGAAAVLAVLHLLLPHMTIDTITVALLVVAILPWLGPLFKSIELPGGWRFEFQEFKRELSAQLEKGADRVEQLETRVDRVEGLVFSGDISQNLVDRLTRTLYEFHDYLVAIGADLGLPDVSVHVGNPILNASYDGSRNQILIHESLVSDRDVLYREYGHHVLMLLIGDPDWVAMREDAHAVESGLADYFACSFNADPVFGRRAAAAYRDAGHKLPHPYLRNLRSMQRINEVETQTPQGLGEVWGAAFWELRDLLEQRPADELLISAWSDWGKTATDDTGEPFTKHLLALVGRRSDAASARRAKRAFDRRGLLPESGRAR